MFLHWEDNQRRWISLLLLVGISLFVCTFTFSLLAQTSSYGWGTLLLNVLVNIPGCLIICFIDYRIIRYLQSRIPARRFFLSIVVGLVLTSLLIGLLSVCINGVFTLCFDRPFNVLRLLMPAVLWNSQIVLVIEIFFFQQRQVENECKLNRMEKEKAVYQFEALKSQMNPHFLFNSLNVLSSLAYRDAEKTNLFAKKLSNVYRYLLDTFEKPTVSLADELRFVDSYLYLERVRFGDNLQVAILQDGSQLHRTLIPAGVQILVENALKHNICTSKSPLCIRISVGSAGVTVANNLQPRSYVQKHGIGLSNLNKQYALHHQQLSIKQTDKEFIVMIPFIE